MKILKLVFLCSVFFLSCNPKKSDTAHFYNVEKIDSLIKRASDKNININQRVFIANKADSIIANSESKLIKNSSYINLANVFFELGNKHKYLNVSNRLYRKSKLIHDNKGISESAFCIAMYFYNTAEYDSSYFYFKKSEKAYLYCNEISSTAFVKIFRANILTFKKDYVGAEKLSIEALKIAKKDKYDLLIYNCYITLGNSLTGLNNYKKAIEYYRRAIVQSNYLKKEPQYINFKTQPYNYIADVYLKNSEYKNAIAVANQALQIDDFKKNDITMYCYLTNNLAYSKFKLGDKSSLNKFLEMLKIGDSLNFAPIQITSKFHLGEYYLDQKDTIKANFYLKEAQQQAHKNTIFEDELEILQFLAKANPNDKSFYATKYITLNDSLQNVERATRDKFARIEFETDEISTQNNVVQTENNQLLNSLWFVLSISFFSIISIYLVYKNKSEKAKTRELILKQEQQKAKEEIYDLMLNQLQKIEEGKNIEKQRISLDLHDGVMGKLTAVRMNLYAEFYKNNLIENPVLNQQIDEIQEVEKEIRQIAHNLNSNLFSDNANFVEIVKELFAKIENHSSLHFTLQVSDAVNWDIINNAIKINLYRILQEALQNIEKYAEAKNVVLVMTKTENQQLQISIADDGKGFDKSLKNNGIGIKNMQTRVSELNGTLQIQSVLQKGTKINLIIPY